MRLLRQNAVALIALAVALSGTAYAAHKIGARDIKRNAIRSPHIKPGQVKSRDLAGGLRRRIATDASPVTAEQLVVKKVDGAPLVLAPGTFDGAPLAQCPPGYVVVGSGFSAGVGEPAFVLAFGTFVGGFFANFSSITTDMSVQAICARNDRGGATTSRAAELRRYRRAVVGARKDYETGARP